MNRHRVLAASFVIGLSAFQASAATEFAVTGKARLRYEDTQSYQATAFQRNAFWSVRVRPSVTMKIDDMATVVAEPQFAKRLGSNYSYAQSGSSGSTTYNENFHMHQGYLQLKFSNELVLKGGRMSASYGNQIILGPADWGVYGRSFDGASLGWKSDLVKAELSSLKVVSTPNTVGSDRDLAVLYTSWNFFEALKAFDLYGLYESNQVAGLNEARHAVGARAQYLTGGFDVGAEYTMQKGTSGFVTTTDATSMVFAELGYTFEQLAKLRIGFEYDQANEHWAEWYPTTKALLGRNDVVGRRNLTAMALRLAAEPDANLKVTLDYWMFSRTSDAAAAFRPDGSAVGTTTASTAKDIGQSIELAALYKASEKVEIGLGAAYFIQGAFLKDNFGDRTLTDFYALAQVNF